MQFRFTLLPLALAAAGFLGAGAAQAAEPFAQCPTQAFLVQDSVPRLYGVDLSTGYVDLLGDNLGTNNKLNGIAFNYADAFIYGWSYEYRTLARLGSDLQLEPITLVQPLDDNYFVGDLSPDGSFYYIYKRGSGGSHGLWRIALQSTDPDHLRPVRIVDGSQLSASIYDFAFHPSDGLLYSVTRSGSLVSIDPGTGVITVIKALGEPGVYGAVYFDVDGKLYISRNADGAIFQIDLDSPSPTALQFAQGPKSGQNDGARCALAPVTRPEQATADFGDAPDSYGTTLAANGARHNTFDSQLRQLGFADVADDLARLMPAGETRAAMDRIPDEVVDTMTITGTPAECAKRLRDYEGLADEVVAIRIAQPDEPAGPAAYDDLLEMAAINAAAS